MSEQRITQSLDRAGLVSLLVDRLRYRWLSDAEIVSRAIMDLFGRKYRRRQRLVADIVALHRAGRLRSTSVLSRFLDRHLVVRQLFKDHATISVTVKSADHESMSHRWPVPPISGLSQLADFLLLPSASWFDWLTLPHCRRRTNVDHYRRRSLQKRDGSFRWIESPKPVLKRVQRIIHREILVHIPTHCCAHGFCRGRCIQTAVEPHVGKSGVLRMDLHDFFGSIRFARVRTLFSLAGYAPLIADTLARLCTAPAIPRDDGVATQLCHSRLPQGAPTSPGIANAVAFRLDRRLTGLSAANGFEYTRYADDLIFSGDEDMLRKAKRFATSTAAIAMEEGFRMNFHKTKVMKQGCQQRVLGMVLNQRQNVPRSEYERLKATLHNCYKHGSASQNRDEHPQFRDSLRGKIAHVARSNPQRGEKLLQAFQRINWDDVS